MGDLTWGNGRGEGGRLDLEGRGSGEQGGFGVDR